MNLTRSLRLAFALLLATHLLMAFGAVALLARMKPAIQRIIDENAYSLEAVEEMMAVLAEANGAPVEEPSAERYRAAHARAATNVTDPRELPVLEALARDLDGTLEGDPRTRRASVESLKALGTINRDDMLRTDRSAQQLGSAGAWAVVFLALLTLVGALVAIRRLDHRVLHPIEELYEVVHRSHRGDAHRRCRPGLGAASELGEIMQTMNTLLDERERTRFPAPDVEESCDRAALLHFLDERPTPALILSDRGRVVAANAAGLDALAERPELRERIEKAVEEKTGGGGVTLTPVADGRRFLISVEG
jgi:hypothetical protein